MAAACVASTLDGTQEVAFPPQRILKHLKTGLGEFTCYTQDMSDVASTCTSTKHNGRCGSASLHYRRSTPTPRSVTTPNATYLKASALVAELLRLVESTPQPYGTPPPPYTEHSEQPPPPYSTYEPLACARVDSAASAPLVCDRISQRSVRSPDNAIMVDAINFGDTSGVLTRAGKGGKKGAKKTQQAKWNEPGDGEGPKNAEDGGEGDGGNAGGGDGANGAGGNDDGGGGGGEDDWDFGGKKNKKKKSKKQEEEEEKKKEEEEQQKLDEEAAAAAAVAAPATGGNFLNWADDANEGNGDDDWTGFSTGKKDKKKKGKKEAADPAVPNPNPTSAFQEISLDDGAPNLDFSFGATDTQSKDTGGGSFGTWGKTWDFNNVGTAATTTDKKDEKLGKAGKGEDLKDSISDLGDNNPWGGKTKAGKKKATSSGFDFDNFGTIDESNDLNLDGDVGTIEPKAVVEETWGFQSVNKKDKKKKGKNIAEEVPVEAPVILPEPEKVEEDTWGTIGAKKDTKKKGKKGAVEEDIAAISPPPPPAVPEPPAADEWSSFNFGKKDKKKGKKGAIEESVPETKEEPIPVEDLTSTLDWGVSTSKKDKKSTKKGLVSAYDDDPIMTLEEQPQADEGIGGAGDDLAGSTWGIAPKKKDKKGKKEVVEDAFAAFESPLAADTITASPPVEDDWTAFSTTTKSKKDKKGKKGDMKAEEAPPPPPVLPEPAKADDTDTWGSFSKKDKKGKKIEPKVEELPPPPPPEPEPPKVEEPDIWGSLGGKKEKKGSKKGKITSPEPVFVPEPEPELEPEPEPEPEIPEVKEESSWGTWGLSSKDKKKKEKEIKEKESKKKSVIELVEEPLSQDIYGLDDAGLADAGQEDTWGTWGATDKKKSKKGKLSDEPPPPAPTPPAQGLTPEPGPTQMPDLDDFGGDGWGGLSAAKTKTTTKKGTLSRTATSTSKTSKGDDSKSKSKDAKLDDFDLPSSKDIAKEEPAPKAVKSMWGSLGASVPTTAKGKAAKEKEEKAKREAEEKARVEAEEEQARVEAEEEQARVEAEEEQARVEAEEAAAVAAAEAAEAEAALSKKGAKSKLGAGKLSKTTSKSSDKTDDKKKKSTEDALLDIVEEPAPKVEKSTSKLKKGSTKSKVVEPEPEPAPEPEPEPELDIEPEEPEPVEEAKGGDYFGFWGGASSSKKTSGKKEVEAKKEITKANGANQKNTLVSFANDLEPPMEDEPSSTTKATKTMPAAGTKGKLTAGTSGVAARIKALEGNKEADRKKSKADSWLTKEADLPEADPEPEPEPSPKEEKKSTSLSKSKSLAAGSSKTVKKKEVPLPVAEEKRSRDSVPGSFPGAFGDDDDLLNLDDYPPVPVLAPTPEKKVSTKKIKEEKKSSKTKTPKMDDLVFEAPEPPQEEKKSSKLKTPKVSDLMFEAPEPPKEKKLSKSKTPKASDLMFEAPEPPKEKKSSKSKTPKASDLMFEAPEPPKLPTPPPEEKAEKKPVKKERARVERTGAAASWGFWGAAPPKKGTDKSSKSKDDSDVSPPPSTKKVKSPAPLTRSKSTKKPREKEREDKKDVEKSLQSSGSDKDAKLKRPEARTSKSGRGLSFSNFMIGGPPPSATRARPMTRRSSTAGAGSRTSSRRQSVDRGGLASPPPDDYQPDLADKAAKLMGVRPGKVDRKQSTKTKTKAAPDPYPIDDDDMVMVNGLDDPIINGRTSTMKEKTSSKSKSKRESKTSKSKDISNDDDVVMVEAGPPGGDPLVTSGPDDMAFVDHPPGLRRSNTAAKKAAGLFGSLFGPSKQPDKPRPKSSYRDDRLAEGADESLPIRSKDKGKRRFVRPATNDGEGFTTDAGGLTAAEADADAEARRAERRSKRDAKENAARNADEADRLDRKARRDREKADLDARSAKKRDRARKEQEVEDQRRGEKRARRTTREVKDEPDVSAEAAARKEERRRLRAELEAQDAAKGKKNSNGKEKDRSGKRKSTAVMDEYFNTRNGNGGQPAPPDKISSWVHSQADDPPDLPPVEATILDGEKPRSLDDEEAELSKKKLKRHSKYAGLTEAEVDDRRVKRKDGRRLVEKENFKSASGGSAEDKYREARRSRRRDTVTDDYDAYAEGGPVKTFDGRPAAAPKRSSFFGKLGGFM